MAPLLAAVAIGSCGADLRGAECHYLIGRHGRLQWPWRETWAELARPSTFGCSLSGEDNVIYYNGKAKRVP